MKQTKDLSFLARAARALTGARRVAAVLLLMLLTMTAQTAWADNSVDISCFYWTNGTCGWAYYWGTTGGTATASIDTDNGPTSISSGDDVAPGTEVTLTATPASGYKFVEWEVGGVTLANQYSATTTFTMPNNSVSFYACFVPSDMFYVSTSVTGLGTVEVSLDNSTWSNSYVVAVGTKVYYRFTPNSGYHLENYSISSGGNAVATDNTDNSFVMPDGDVTITADFSALYVTMIPAQGGGTYRVVDNTKLYVTPATGYYLKSVTKEGIQPPLESFAPVDGDPYYSVSAGDIITITFHKWGDYDDVRVTFNRNGHGTAPPAQSLHLGDKVTRPEDPTADGYVFLGWYKNSSCTNPYDFDTVLDNTLHYDTSNDRYTLTLYAKWAVGGSCGKTSSDNVKWYVSKSAGSSQYDVLTIFGSGAMADYYVDNTPWHSYRNEIKTVVVEEGVTAIGESAFFEFVNVTSDITIPASVTSIGNRAFQSVSESTSAGIHISAAEGSALTSIGEKAFDLANVGIDLSRCNSLNNLSYIYIFRAVTKDVILPSSMTSICKWAFNRYDDYAFSGDHAYVVVPEGKALSVTITLDEGTESRVLVPTDGKADILRCLYVDPDVKRTLSRALTLATVDMLGDNNCTMTGWDGTTRDVALCRTLPAGKKQTVCLPFAPEALLSLGTVWEFTGIEGGKAVMTQRTSGLTANTPYIFEANASNPDVTGILFPSVNISISSDPKTAPDGEDFVFQGTYSRIDWAADALPAGLYGFVANDDKYSQGEFVKAYKDTFIRPFRAYLLYTGSGDLSGTETATARRTSAEELPDVIDIVWVPANGAATGITTTNLTNFTNAADAWYSLDGRRLSGQPTKKGMYLNNGKKIIIK
ncbi:MAG: InlB B-repeat-containing protein [Prevotella sp.]|nr:InlB B-repeat-containing protein [Prevotella sp.]